MAQIFLKKISSSKSLKFIFPLLFGLILGMKNFFVENRFYYWMITGILSLFPIYNLYMVIVSWKRAELSLVQIIKYEIPKVYERYLGRYLKFDLQIYRGAIAFLFSPIVSWQKAKNSYFWNPAISGILMAICCALFIETSMIHIIIHSYSTGHLRIALHCIMAFSTLYLLVFIVSNIYYLKDSTVSIENGIFIKIGVFLSISLPIDSIASYSLEQKIPEEKYFKVSLLNQPNLFLNLNEKITINILFLEKQVQTVKVFLKEKDLKKIKKIFDERA